MIHPVVDLASHFISLMLSKVPPSSLHLLLHYSLCFLPHSSVAECSTVCCGCLPPSYTSSHWPAASQTRQLFCPVVTLVWCLLWGLGINARLIPFIVLLNLTKTGKWIQNYWQGNEESNWERQVENEHINLSFAIRLQTEGGGKDKGLRKSAGK